VDNKEHLAIVFGKNIRSKSLDAVREGETEMDRMVRGAYTGRLFPGRTTSGIGPATPQEEQPPQASDQPPLVRIHSECYTGETAWSARCDCGEQLDEAARLMSLPGNKAGGIIIYLRQEGRGIGLGEKLKAYNLQDLGSDTVEANLLLRHPADARSYGLATAMLLDLGQPEVRLLTNNPDKIRAVEGPNREVVVKERVAMVPLSWKGRGGFRSQEVEGYLKTKVSITDSFLLRAMLTANFRSRRWAICWTWHQCHSKESMRERNINTRNTGKEEKERDNFNKASILSSLHSMEFIHSLGIDLDGVVRWSFDVCCMVDKTTFQQVSELLYISVSLSHVPVSGEFASCSHHGWCHEGIAS
jgi:GTP cyclohydrolase II